MPRKMSQGLQSSHSRSECHVKYWPHLETIQLLKIREMHNLSRSCAAKPACKVAWQGTRVQEGVSCASLIWLQLHSTPHTSHQLR